MKQVVNVRKNISIEEVPEPTIGDNEVLVANIASTISTGTETHTINLASKNLIKLAIDIAKTRPELLKKVKNIMRSQGIIKTYHLVKDQINEPIILGYSSAGVVVEVGKNVDDIKVGDRVACGGGGYAVHAEFVRVPKNLCIRIPENVSFEEAAFTTIGAIALQGVRRADVRIGERVGVIGLGLIGLLTVQLLKATGCKVVGFDINKKKVELAMELGADAAYQVGTVTPVKMAEIFSKGVGLDAVIITASTPSNQPVEQALQMIRKKGRVVVVGSVGMKIPREPFYQKEADFLISTSYGPGRYDPQYEEKGIDYPIAYVRWTERRNMEAFLELVSEGKVKLKPLITHRFPIERAKEAYEVAKSGRAIGIVITYTSPEERTSFARIVKISTKSSAKDKLNVGLIGAGNFTRLVLLPNLKKISDINIRAISALTGPKLKHLAKKYNADYITTDYRKILEDPNVDLVVITTRHNLHAKIAIEALKAGKHVYVEKPLALNIKDLEEVISVAEKSPGILFVGFNRRFSPLTEELKKTVNKAEGPMVINYIVNAGPLPADYWIYDPEEGGGRIIGECVHFFDLMNYIIDSSPKEISVMAIDSDISTIRPDDNIVVSIKYRDGSVGNLIYSSIGNPRYPKEVIHIQRAGIVAELKDFKDVMIYGRKTKKKSLRHQDKGHYNELVYLVKGIRTGTQPTPLEDIYLAHELAFKVVEAVRNL